MPEGPIMAEGMKRILRVPPGEVYMRVESPRGEYGVYLVSNGADKPYRHKVRGASFCNLSALRAMSVGHYVADVIIILGSIDIVLWRGGPLVILLDSPPTSLARRARRGSADRRACCVPLSASSCSPGLSARSSAGCSSGSGPMRVGPYGMLQGIADTIKLLTKEDVRPDDSRPLDVRAGAVRDRRAGVHGARRAAVHGGHLRAATWRWACSTSSPSPGSRIVGFVMAGWGSDNKYALLGGVRAGGAAHQLRDPAGPGRASRSRCWARA